MTPAFRCMVLICAFAGGPASAQDIADVPAVVPIGTRVGGGYDEGGRRDPFVGLVGPKREDGSAAKPRPGLSGLAVAAAAVSGVARSGGSMLAIVEASAGRSFVARPGDELLDGRVESIDEAGVVFLLTTSSGPSRVRKPLRSSEGTIR
jgi:hypothetical protein